MNVASDNQRKLLLSSDTSRMNKIWLAGSMKDSGVFVEWKFQGAFMRSRMLFRFGENDEFKIAKSYEEDVHAKLDDLRPQKS